MMGWPLRREPDEPYVLPPVPETAYAYRVWFAGESNDPTFNPWRWEVSARRGASKSVVASGEDWTEGRARIAAERWIDADKARTAAEWVER